MTKETTPRLVPAVERAAAIMDHLSGTSRALSLSEIARDLGLAKSSAHGLCQTLVHLGLLREEAGRYSPGGHALKWASAAIQGNTLAREFHALLARLPLLARHTVTLAVLEGGESVYIACQNSTDPLGVTFRIGMRMPAPFTATGKAMLAHLPGPAAHVPIPPPLTPRSTTDRQRLMEELETCRARGYSLDDGQIREGMVCLGAPIFGPRGLPVAAAAVSLTSAEASVLDMEGMGAAIKTFAQDLSELAVFLQG